MSRCRLTIQGKGESRVVLLNQWVVEVGSQTPCDVVVPSHQVSNPHCRLLRTDRGYVLEDLGSATGSYVNGRNIKYHRLQGGDEIRVGDVTIRYDDADDDPDRFSVVDDRDPTTTFRLDYVGQTSAARDLFSGAEGTRDKKGKRAAVKIAILYEFIRTCADIRSEEELLDMAARSLCTLPHTRRAQVVYCHPKTESLQRRTSVTPAGSEPSSERGLKRDVVRRVLQRGEAVLCEYASADGSDEKLADATSREAGDFIAIPLRQEKTIFGLATLSALPESGGFARDDLEFAVAFGGLLEREIERQRNLQLVVNENLVLRETLGEDRSLVGKSPQICKLLEQVEKAGGSDATVLILGESGTGKELVARALHRLSPRSDRAFVSVNCAVLQEELLASDLFGHLKGSFTGAASDRAGKFELADGGTLFFDEIGELPHSLQAKLLRALEEGEIERVGGGEPRAVDVRVITATNRDLAIDLKNGSFREDLYYRLNVVEIRVPPLRERLGDVSRLLSHFLDFFSRKTGRRRLRVPAEILDLLERYSWPGNVRELRNLVERWVVMNETGVVSSDDLPTSLPRAGEQGRVGAAGMRTLEELEREHIKEILGGCDQNKSRAAKILGIHRSTLYEKMQKYGLG